jgi:hypothetical protein
VLFDDAVLTSSCTGFATKIADVTIAPTSAAPTAIAATGTHGFDAPARMRCRREVRGAVVAGGTVSDTGAEYGAAGVEPSCTRSIGRVTSAPLPVSDDRSLSSAMEFTFRSVLADVEDRVGGTHDGGSRT